MPITESRPQRNDELRIFGARKDRKEKRVRQLLLARRGAARTAQRWRRRVDTGEEKLFGHGILDAVIAVRLGQTRDMLAQWEACGPDPVSRIRSFIHILIANQPLIMRHGCPVGTLCTELAKLGHPSLKQANAVFTLFRAWLRKQFTLLGRKPDADTLAMHLLARSQGVAALANAFREKSFVQSAPVDLKIHHLHR